MNKSKRKKKVSIRMTKDSIIVKGIAAKNGDLDGKAIDNMLNIFGGILLNAEAKKSK